jgi:hypothetical protein
VVNRETHRAGVTREEALIALAATTGRVALGPAPEGDVQSSSRCRSRSRWSGSWQLFEIVGQLVAGVTVTTVFDESGRRSVQVRIDYRFGPPREPTVRGATDCTGTRSAARP